jgi:hypothetical protein
MDTTRLNRREFLALAGLTGAGIAGVVFASGLRHAEAAQRRPSANDFCRCRIRTGVSGGLR